jgi:hypothetical protein
VGYWPFEEITDLGKKLGSFINKPVVIKMTDWNQPVSEETIQE